MAPNLLLKAAFVRGENDPISQNLDLQFTQDAVRTDFIVQNIFSHLLKHDFDLPEVKAKNAVERAVLITWKNDVDSFKSSYSDALSSICSDVVVSVDTADVVLEGIANELFCEGITWSRIMALFLFTSQVSAQYHGKSSSQDVVHVICQWLCKYVTKSLQKWVEDHGGWEGVERSQRNSIGDVTQNDNDAKLTQSSGERSGWAKSVFRGTLKVIGTLAQIANATGQSMSNPINLD